jgi:hypothetical protein
MAVNSEMHRSRSSGWPDIPDAGASVRQWSLLPGST